MTQSEDAVRGVTLAAEVIKSVAAGDDSRALALINGADTAGVRWCAAYLASAIRGMAMERAKGRPARARRELLDRANRALRDDVLCTTIEVSLHEGVTTS